MGWSKPEKQKEPEPLNLRTERLTTNKTARPIPSFWGLHRSAGTYLDGIWNPRTEPITEKVKTGKRSSKRVTRAINYYGSIIQAIGYGPMTRLRAILKDDEKTNEPNRIIGTDFADYLIQFDTKDNVNMKLFTANAPSRFITGLNGDHPGYKNLIMMNWEGLLFGTQPSPPNFELIFEVVHKHFDLSAHQSSDHGQFIPEIIFSALTDPIIGGSVNPDRFDIPSWEAACERLIDEDLGYSAVLRSKKSVDSWIKNLLNFCGGEISDQGGKIRFSLNRSDAPTIAVPESKFIKDAQISPSSWDSSDVVNEVRINYFPLETDLESVEVVETDDASQEIVGLRTKAYSFDGIRSQETAAKIASRLAKSKGFPTVKYQFTFDSSMDFLRKNDIIIPEYSPQGISGTRIRITDIDYGKPGSSSVSVKGELDKSYVYDLQSSDQDAELSVVNPEPQDIRGHITFIPEELQEGFDDGFILGLTRDNPADDQAFIAQSYDDVAYQTIISTRVFPTRVNVLKWRDFGEGNYTADIQFTKDHEEQYFLDSLTDGPPDWTLLTQPVIPAGQDQRQSSLSSVRPDFDIVPLGNSVYRVAFTSGSFQTPVFANTPDASQPREVAYFAPLAAFEIYRSNQLRFKGIFRLFNGLLGPNRFYTVQSVRRNVEQDEQDVFKISYNRDTGVFSPTWGPGSQHDFEFALASSNTSGVVPLTSSLDITGTEDADYTIDWGDGSPVLSRSSQSMPSNETHDYTTAGSYTAIISVQPAAGGAPKIFEVTITADPTPPPPGP